MKDPDDSTEGQDDPPHPRGALPGSDKVKAMDPEADRLVARFQAGDQSALDELYRMYYGPLHLYASTILRDHHEAEDLVQQVFIEAIRKLPRFEIRPGDPLRAWLYRVTRNRVVDAIRERSRLVLEEPMRIEERREASRFETEGEAAALDGLGDQDVTFLLRRLPPTQRQVIALHDLLGFKLEEVARIVGKSLASIYNIRSRALDTLEVRLTALERRTGGRRRRSPALMRVKRGPVIRSRKWALGGTTRAGAMARASGPRWRF